MTGYNYNRYGDNLARRKQRRFFLIISGVIILFFTLAGFLIYLLFFTSSMKLTEINLNGLKSVKSEEIFKISDSIKNKIAFGIVSFKPRNNILFFDTSLLKSRILSEFLVVKDVNISKEFPHKINVEIRERVPIGTWCSMTNCHYFDQEGVLWGNALRSSGSLLLNIDDLRILDKKPRMLSREILEPIQKAVLDLDTVGIKIKKVSIPAEAIGDFRIDSVARLAEVSSVARAGYYILFNNDTDISGQVRILKILLDEKGKEFKPEYLDLRIDGRVYYK